MPSEISGDELRDILDSGAKIIEAAEAASEDIARATGGEGAVELEASVSDSTEIDFNPGRSGARLALDCEVDFPVRTHVVLAPATARGRDEIRTEAEANSPNPIRIEGLIPGPRGQMVDGGHRRHAQDGYLY